MAQIRPPAVAGQFYPLKPRELREQMIKSFAGPRIPAVIKKERLLPVCFPMPDISTPAVLPIVWFLSLR